METADRLTVLTHKRETIRKHIVQFSEFLKNFKPTNEDDNNELQLRFQTITSRYAEINEITEEIDLIDTKNNHNDYNNKLQNLYFQAVAKAQTFMRSIYPQQNSNTETRDATDSEKSSGKIRRKLKLPVATLPTFNGKIEEWMSFKDAFNTLIDRYGDLTNIEKLHYLKSALKDEALRKIQILSITDENYQHAWNILEKSYEDKRVLISRNLNLLLRLPVQEKETDKGLVTLADESQQYMQSLLTLGVNVGDEMVVAILESKLYKTTLDKWEETLKKGRFPKFEELVEFLYRIAARISKRKHDQTS